MNKKIWLIMTFLASLLVAPILVKSTYIIHILIMCLWIGTLGAALDLSAGYIGLVNFGYSGFIGIGAYTSALIAINFSVSPFIGILIGGLVSALLGAFLGFVTLRLHEFYFTIFTLFTSEALRYAFANLVDLTRGYLGLFVPPFPGFDPTSRLHYYYILLGISLAILFISSIIINSRLGIAFKAIREDEIRAATLGLNVIIFKVINVTLSCFFAGILGGFYAHYIGILTPDIMGSFRTIEVLTVTYVGGRASLWGSLVGAFILIPFTEILRPLVIVRLMVYGLGLITIILLYPKGLASYLKKLWR
ncbi:MAG: branched-chain amino acid ABC transporter permease [Nitrososphaeria archaeon]